MALGGRRDVLVAVVDHAHRPLRLERQQRRVDRHDRGVLLLAAEAAAGLGLDHDRLAVGQGQRALERGMDVVGALERAVDGDAAVRARDRDHALVLDVQLLLVADPVGALDDQVGARHARSRRRRCRPRSGRTRGPTRAGRRPPAAARCAVGRRVSQHEGSPGRVPRAVRPAPRDGGSRRSRGRAGPTGWTR